MAGLTDIQSSVERSSCTGRKFRARGTIYKSRIRVEDCGSYVPDKVTDRRLRGKLSLLPALPSYSFLPRGLLEVQGFLRGVMQIFGYLAIVAD